MVPYFNRPNKAQLGLPVTKRYFLPQAQYSLLLKQLEELIQGIVNPVTLSVATVVGRHRVAP